MEGIERVLGGYVRDSDASAGRIEATFGLVNSERLSVSVEPLESNRSRVIIESRRSLSPEPARESQYVDVLANWLSG